MRVANSVARMRGGDSNRRISQKRVSTEETRAHAILLAHCCTKLMWKSAVFLIIASDGISFSTQTAGVCVISEETSIMRRRARENSTNDEMRQAKVRILLRLSISAEGARYIDTLVSVSILDRAQC